MYTLETTRYRRFKPWPKNEKKNNFALRRRHRENRALFQLVHSCSKKKALSESFPPSTFWPSHHNDQKKSSLILKAFTFPLLTHFVHLGQITCLFTKCLISEIQQELPISTIRRSGGLFSHLKSMKYMLYPPLKTDIPLQIDPWVRWNFPFGMVPFPDFHMLSDSST